MAKATSDLSLEVCAEEAKENKYRMCSDNYSLLIAYQVLDTVVGIILALQKF